MKTNEVEVGTAYHTKSNGVVVPLRRSEWKAGSWDVAESTEGNAYLAKNYGDWAPVTGLHSSQFVETVEQRDARNRTAAIEAEVRRIEREQRARLEEAERMDRWGGLLALAVQAFPELRVQVDDRYDWNTGGKVPELRIGWLDYADAAQWFLKVSRELGSVCSELPRSTAMAEPLAAVAIGLTPEPTGHTTDMVFKGEPELEALQTVLAAEVAR